MTVGERVKFIREDLGLSQAGLGSTMGVSRDVINNIERDRVKNPDTILRLFCKTHRVSYLFITEGFGDPYIGVPSIIMDDVIEEYDLDEIDKLLIEEYVRLDKNTRTAFKQYLSRVFEKASD